MFFSLALIVRMEAFSIMVPTEEGHNSVENYVKVPADDHENYHPVDHDYSSGIKEEKFYFHHHQQHSSSLTTNENSIDRNLPDQIFTPSPLFTITTDTHGHAHLLNHRRKRFNLHPRSRMLDVFAESSFSFT